MHGFCSPSPGHEELWNLKGATAKTHLLWAGDILVELRQYTNPAQNPGRVATASAIRE
jgi:hypothetical protein